jgi:Uma2 family endonuclease
MTTATQKLITAEEFFQMPEPADGSRQELIRGVIVTMPPPMALHGFCCSRIDRRLGAFVEANQLGMVFCNDTGFHAEHNPDTVRGVDVGFWSRDRLPQIPERYIEVPPDLAVEVVSPNDHFTRVQKKLKLYLALNVRLIWIVDPEDRSVTVYRPGHPVVVLGENDTLTGEDVLPGFTCRVGELFP